MKRQAVVLDYNNMMAERIGPRGLSYAEIEAAGQKVAQAVEWFYSNRAKGKLDFFDLPENDEYLKQSLALARIMKGRGDDLVVLGIGGSALGTIAVQAALNPVQYNYDPKVRQGRPRMWVLDNVDPEKLSGILSLLKPNRTLVNVISKSGTTAETSAQFLWIRSWLMKSLKKKWGKQVVITTDPREGVLRQIAQKEGLLSLEVPSGVGGRFSVFTPVGLFPLAMAGVDVKLLLEGARSLRRRTLEENPWRNPARLYALVQYLLYQKGYHINVMMPYSEALYPLADWFRQLWAESLGKKMNNQGQMVETGPTPVKALGATDQHSQLQLYIEGPRDKTVTFIRVEEFRKDIAIPRAYAEHKDLCYLGGHTFGELLNAEARATAMSLAKNGRPNCTFVIPKIDAWVLGQLIFLLETATAFAGGLFGINPMDQPGVEEGKRYAYGLLGKDGFENRKVEVEKFESSAEERFVV